MIRKVKIYIGNAAEFKPENYYELPDYTVNENGEVFDKDNIKLKEHIHKGYKYVKLELNSKIKYCKVHRIVACTFTDICGNFNEVVNHLDENKLNNCATNLKWTTNKENLLWGNIEKRKQEGALMTSKIKKYIKSVYDFYYDLKYNGKIKIHKYKRNYVANDKINEIRIHIPINVVYQILNCENIDELAYVSYIKPDNNHYKIYIRERKNKNTQKNT